MARTTRKMLRRTVPAWWSDAKLGIFIHWTPASVAGWAPVDRDINELVGSTDPVALSETPYTEWYQNSLRFEGSSVSRYHREVWGNRPYEEFGDDFRDALDGWDPDGWARKFAETGARYVVLVTKHHDGYCLWPSDVGHPDPSRRGWNSGRDVVGELAEAVRGVGLRFGVYYSGGLDWTFDDRPIGAITDSILAIPRGDYPAYADAQVRELIRRYKPSVLWNDIAWPGDRTRMFKLFADYYAAVPDGVVNDRWMPWHPAIKALEWGPAQTAVIRSSARLVRSSGGLVPPTPPHFDVRTPEYTVLPDIQYRPWECVRGIDLSFGFNRNSDESRFLSRDDLLTSFVDIVSKGGNLLLNVGPRGEDAIIPDEQRRRLDWLVGLRPLGEEALVATRPWVRPGAVSPEGHDLRFTCRDRTVYAWILSGPTGGAITVPGIGLTSGSSCRVVGSSSCRVDPHGDSSIRVELPPNLGFPSVIALDGAEARP